MVRAVFVPVRFCFFLFCLDWSGLRVIFQMQILGGKMLEVQVFERWCGVVVVSGQGY